MLKRLDEDPRNTAVVIIEGLPAPPASGPNL
jgi:hypothetical protein